MLLMRRSNFRYKAVLVGAICFPLTSLNVFAESRSSGQGAGKNFLISLPLVTAGHEGAVRAELNLANRGAVALDWAEWGSGAERRQDLSPQDIKAHPKDAFLTEGRDMTVMMSKYNNPGNMSGFHWGLGLGYRAMQAELRKTPSLQSQGDAVLLNDGQVLNNIDISGPTVSGRVGYRHVGEEVGFSIGTFLGVKHFQNKISNAKQDSNKDIAFSPISEKDSDALSARLTTAIKIGVEIGWAF